MLVSLKSEPPKAEFPECNVQYIGLGKVIVSLGICRYFQQFTSRTVINFGIADAICDGLNGLVNASVFYWCDMDARPMGLKFGQKPFEDAFGNLLDRLGTSCRACNSFVTKTPVLVTDIFDIDAFVLTKFAKQAGGSQFWVF